MSLENIFRTHLFLLQPWFTNWWEDQRTWSLNTLGEDDTLWCVKTIFLLYFFEGGDLKIQLSWSLKGINIGWHLCNRNLMIHPSQIYRTPNYIIKRKLSYSTRPPCSRTSNTSPPEPLQQPLRWPPRQPTLSTLLPLLLLPQASRTSG